MIAEKGVLPIGIEKDGKVHRDFEVRAEGPEDRGDVVKEQGADKIKNYAYLDVCLLAKQLVRIGEISPVPVDLVMEMHVEDFDVLMEAAELLRQRARD
jgi:hypothetical protein